MFQRHICSFSYGSWSHVLEVFTFLPGEEILWRDNVFGLLVSPVCHPDVTFFFFLISPKVSRGYFFFSLRTVHEDWSPSICKAGTEIQVFPSELAFFVLSIFLILTKLGNCCYSRLLQMSGVNVFIYYYYYWDVMLLFDKINSN